MHSWRDHMARTHARPIGLSPHALVGRSARHHVRRTSPSSIRSHTRLVETSRILCGPRRRATGRAVRSPRQNQHPSGRAMVCMPFVTEHPVTVVRAPTSVDTTPSGMTSVSRRCQRGLKPGCCWLCYRRTNSSMVWPAHLRAAREQIRTRHRREQESLLTAALQCAHVFGSVG
jgi:hypothetical protein